MGMAVIHWGMRQAHEQKIPKYHLIDSSRGFSTGQQWCGKTQISIYPQKLQHLDQYLINPGHLNQIC